MNILLVIDVQNGFTREGALASPRSESVIPAVVKEVERARDENRPIIFTRDTHIPDDKEFEVFPAHCIDGTSEHRLVDEFYGLEGEAYVLDKSRYSALYESPLHPLIGLLAAEALFEEQAARITGGSRPAPSLGIDVVGICTDICVLHTVADLRNRDYKVRVLADATETFDAPGHPGEETKEWALGHIERVLGAAVVRGGKS